MFEVAGPESGRWDAVWNSLSGPQRDVFANRHYYRAYALLDPDSQPECAILSDKRGTLLYPYFRSSLAAYPWLEAPAGTFHIITAYGYGGIYGDCTEHDLMQEFLDRHASHCIATGVVAELMRLNPMTCDQQGLRGSYDLKRVSSQIAVSLQRPDDEIWSSYRHNNRKNINKAIRSGIEVFGERILGGRFGDFLEIYAHTMNRREAKKHFFYPLEFYEYLSSELGEGCMVFYAVLEGKTISVELVLHSDTTVYSFLGGTIEDYYEIRPNNLLKHEIIRWARDSGFDHYLLGGGPGGSDGIFEYKRSFAPHGEVDFVIASRVHDSETYEQLIEKCMSHHPQSLEAASSYPLRWMYGSG